MTRKARWRGQPLVALGGVLVCWVAARAAILGLPGTPEISSVAPLAANTATPVAAADRSGRAVPVSVSPGFKHTPQPLGQFSTPLLLIAPQFDVPPVPPSPRVPPRVEPAANAVAGISAPAPSPRSDVAVMAGHQLLYAAAFAQLPLPAAALTGRATPPGQPIAQPRQTRWSGDGWLLLRPDYGGSGLAVGPTAFYGASQAGAVVRYRLAPRSRRHPFAYLRATTALDRLDEREVAAGLSIRPAARLPLRAAAELRVTQDAGRTRLRPAGFVVSELPPLHLPHGFRAEVYAQAGVVGGRGATAFVDAQARIDRRLIGIGSTELRGGGGAWSGAQAGAGRVDIGPGLTLGMPVGSASARLSADWRFRIAGQAAPASGPAITLSAGF